MEGQSCCACLVAGTKLYNLDDYDLKHALEDLTGLTVPPKPQYLCYLCSALVFKYAAFRAEYRYTHIIILGKGQLGKQSKKVKGALLEYTKRKRPKLCLTITNNYKFDICNETVNTELFSPKTYYEFDHDRDVSIKNETKDDENLLNSTNITKVEIEVSDDTLNTIKKEEFVFVDDKNEYEIAKEFDNDQFDTQRDTLSENFDEFNKNDDRSMDAESDGGNLNENPLSEVAIEVETNEEHTRNKIKNETIYEEFKNEEANHSDADSDVWELADESNNECKKTKQPKSQKIDLEDSNLVIIEPDEYSPQVRSKTVLDYRKFAKKHNMKVEFFISKEERLKEFLARKDSDNYRLAHLKCDVCYNGFTTDTAYANHVKAHEKDEKRRFECDLCRSYFYTSRARIVHLEGHKTKYTCLECGEHIVTKNGVIRHSRTHSGYLYSCKMCPKTFRLAGSYFGHLRQWHANERCALCGQAFSGAHGLGAHMKRAHREALDCFCASCGRQFSNEAARTTHEDSCSPDNSPCVRCGASFPSAELLDEHVTDAHTSTFSCRECNKEYSNEKKLKRHRFLVHKILHRTRETKEDGGRKRQADTEGLDDEERKKKRITHNILRLCHLCGKIIKQPTFEYHMRIHTHEKPYRCEVCLKMFRNVQSLKTHTRCHTDERPYACHLCQKTFRQAPHRNSHMLTHTGEKPYSCLLCSGRFISQGNLREHVRTLHEGLPPSRKNRTRTKHK